MPHLRMEQAHTWRGGRHFTPQGYVRVYRPDHPRANGGYVYEHVLIAEKALGRYLDPKHPVHHVDENGLNNRRRNLVICEDDSYHKLLHQRRDAYRACGDASARRCRVCQRYDRQEEIRIYRGNSPHHVSCHNADRRRVYRRSR